MTQGMVNLVEFAHVIDLLDRNASPASVDRALRAAGVTRKAIRKSHGFVPYRLEAQVVEHVARATGNERLGVNVAQEFSYQAYDAYARYVLSAPDLKSAVQRGQQAFSLINPGSEIVLDVQGEYLVAGRRSGLDGVIGHRHLDDGALVILTHFFQHFLGPDWRPEWLEIAGSDERRGAYLQDTIGAPLRNGANMPGVTIRLEDLCAPNPLPPQPDQVLLLSELPSIMGVRPITSARDLVWHTLSIRFAMGDMSQEGVAEQLNVGSRTLQRMLKSEGTSFREVKTEFIKSRAEALLAETGISITSIAYSLGYDEPKSFQRAFRKVNGLTPKAYRQSAVGA